MSEELKLRVRRAAFGTLAALALLLILLQGIFAVVVGGERWVDHTHDVRLTAQRLATALGTAEAAQRAQLLFGDHLSLPRYQLARQDTIEALDRLHRLVQDNPDQVAAVAALRPLVERRLTDLARTLDLAGGGARDAAITFAREAAQRALPIPERLAAIQAAEGKLLAEREGRVEILRLVFLAGGIAMAVLLGLLLWRQFRRAVSEAEREIVERANLERVLEEKLGLLREINHRVGNSLAMVGALLHIQTTGAADTRIRTALQEARARVTAVGRVHQRLMNAGTVDTLDLAEHLPALCDEIVLALDRTGQIDSRVRGSIVVPVETGVALSLLINELAAATLLARGSAEPGPLRLALRREGEAILLTLTDPAGCLPEDLLGPHRLDRTGDWDAPGGQEMGVRSMVVAALLGQLGATPVLKPDSSELRLTIPVVWPVPRPAPAAAAAGGS
ncbi:sensor histidine kinase [Oleisolibacter albus]|uniref:sensor histidine kinase n=1 Tax=Oleisolibacter albus TaxID=2171757 RepID=UPI00138FCE22|nr:CHASE3 domain-containing protein [Oleisolibacter albus]